MVSLQTLQVFLGQPPEAFPPIIETIPREARMSYIHEQVLRFSLDWSQVERECRWAGWVAKEIETRLNLYQYGPWGG